MAAKPVQAPCTYTDTWGMARSGGRVHLGTDIMAKEGQEVYAVQTGEITKLYSEATDVLAGNGLRLRQADGTFWFYGHMSALAPGIVARRPGHGRPAPRLGRPHRQRRGRPPAPRAPPAAAATAVNSYPIIVASGGACCGDGARSAGAVGEAALLDGPTGRAVGVAGVALRRVERDRSPRPSADRRRAAPRRRGSPRR